MSTRRSPSARRGPLNAELPRAAGRGVGARRRNRSHDRPRPLADARAVRRLGRCSSSSCCSASARAPIRRRATSAPRARSRRDSRSASPSSKVLLLVGLRDSRVGDARQGAARRERSDRRPRRRRAVRVERALSRVRTASSAAPTSSSCRADNPLGLDRTDPNAKDDITTINQLNLPVDRPVLVHLSSKDVIHSFGLYEMRVKQDAIPGMDIPVWFIPNRVGRLRDHLLAALRPRPLPDARLRDRAERRRLSDVVRRPGEGAARRPRRRRRARSAAVERARAVGTVAYRLLELSSSDLPLDGPAIGEVGRRHIFDSQSQRLEDRDLGVARAGRGGAGTSSPSSATM